MSEAVLAKLRQRLTPVQALVSKQRLTPVEALVFFLALVPACYQGIAILKYGVNVPYYDDWSQVYLFQETSQGTLSFDDLIRQNNEARPFFPNLLTIVLAFLTNWDLRYEMLVTFLLACLTSFNVYRLGKLTIEGSRLKRLTIFLLSNLFIFAPIQAENWLWGFQYIVFVPIACITTCLLVAYSRLGTKTKLLTCVLLATVSTFSFSNGILAWIVILPVIASSRTWRDSIRKGPLVLAWITGFALNAALYFISPCCPGVYGFRKPLQFAAPYEALFHPVEALQWFLSFLGAPYSPSLRAAMYFLGAPYIFSPESSLQLRTLGLATILGGVLLFLFVLSCVYLLFRRNSALIHRALGWLVIGAYSIITAIVTAFGRMVSDGVESALAPRYPQFQLYLAVSLIYLMPLVLGDATLEGNSLRSRIFTIAFGPSRRRLFTTAFGSSLVVIVLFLHLLTSAYFVTERIPVKSLERSNSKVCVLLIDVVQDKCLTKVYPIDVDVLRNSAIIANNLGFLTPGLVESDKIRDLEGARSADYGYFDLLTKTDEDSYLAEGWAVSPEETRPADAVLLTYEDANGEPTVFAVSDTRTERPDVAEGLGIYVYARSGWQESFTPSAVPQGPTEIAAWAFDADTKRAFKLGNTHVLEQPRDSLEATS